MKKIMKMLMIPLFIVLLIAFLGIFFRPHDQPGFNPQTGKMAFVLLDRKGDGNLLGGVCAGAERRFGLDRWLCRGGFIVLTFAGGIGPVLYTFYWIFVPDCSENCGFENESLVRS